VKIYTYASHVANAVQVVQGTEAQALALGDDARLWGEGTEAELISQAVYLLKSRSAHTRAEARNVLDYLTESPKPNAIDTTAEMHQRERDAADDKMATAFIDCMTRPRRET